MKHKTKSNSKDINAFFGPGTTFQGRLEFQGTLRIDGDFQGEIESDGVLVVGEKARLTGEFQVRQLVLNGALNGRVTAQEKVVLHKTALLQSDVTTPTMEMHEKAVFNGTITMGAQESSTVSMLQEAS